MTATTTGVIAGFVGWGLVLAIVGGLLTKIGPWYHRLRKPAWQPPRWAFAPAWTIIFALAAWAGVLAWRGADAAGHRTIVVVYLVNGVANVAWSALFFTWRRPDRALVEVAVLWSSIIAMMVGVASCSATAAWLLAPYLAWVGFAAVLNRAIVRLNAPFG